jgi:hypothetical protein
MKRYTLRAALHDAAICAGSYWSGGIPNVICFADTLSQRSPAFSICRGIRICDGSSGIAFIVTRGKEMTEEVAGEEKDDAGCSA